MFNTATEKQTGRENPTPDLSLATSLSGDGTWADAECASVFNVLTSLGLQITLASGPPWEENAFDVHHTFNPDPGQRLMENIQTQPVAWNKKVPKRGTKAPTLLLLSQWDKGTKLCLLENKILYKRSIPKARNSPWICEKCLSQWEENIQRKNEIISKDILPEATLYQKIEQNQA